jgi:hypothetical protein
LVELEEERKSRRKYPQYAIHHSQEYYFTRKVMFNHEVQHLNRTETSYYSIDHQEFNCTDHEELRLRTRKY